MMVSLRDEPWISHRSVPRQGALISTSQRFASNVRTRRIVVRCVVVYDHVTLVGALHVDDQPTE